MVQEKRRMQLSWFDGAPGKAPFELRIDQNGVEASDVG